MIRPIYSNQTICDTCAEKLKTLLDKGGEASGGE